MKQDSEGHDNAGEWRDFLKTIEEGYRRLDVLTGELDAINAQEWDSSEARALREDYARTCAEVLTREAFIEHCRREGMPAPVLARHTRSA